MTQCQFLDGHEGKQCTREGTKRLLVADYGPSKIWFQDACNYHYESAHASRKVNETEYKAKRQQGGK